MPTDTPTLNLTPAQLEHLNKHGTLLVWVPMPQNEQPPAGSDLKRSGSSGGYYVAGRPSSGFRFPPHRLGDRVECYKYFETANAHGVEGYLIARVTTTPEPVRLGDVTETQAKKMGYTGGHMSGIRGPYSVKTPRTNFASHAITTHPGITPGSWGWVFTIRKEN